MPKIQDPYTCEICNGQKKPSNGWFLARVESPNLDDVKVIIIKWNPDLADSDDLDIKHICGLDCASRWVVRELAKIYGNQVTS